MATVDVGDVEICYELDRKPDEPVLLLVSGLGGQLTGWDPGFLDMLASAGFGLLRFDNRDVGFTTSSDGTSSGTTSSGTTSGNSAPYDLVDMAADAAGLLASLGIDSAHVLGVSMGGMIAQQLAISFPERVASLCSIMSMTGAPGAGMPTPEALEVLLEVPPSDRDGYLDHQVKVWRVIGSPGFPFDEARVRRKAEAAYDRRFNPSGVARQMHAILSSPDRTEALGALRMPVLVIHGDGDCLVTPSGGAATAAAVPGSTFLEIPGMGHDLNPEVWDEVVSAVTENARRALGRGAVPGVRP